MDDQLTCPRCDGSGRTVAICVMRRSGKGGPAVTACSTCRGTGKVPLDHQERVDAGRALRDQRVDASIGIGELARAAGIRPTEVSDVEFGRADKEIVEAYRVGLNSLREEQGK